MNSEKHISVSLTSDEHDALWSAISTLTTALGTIARDDDDPDCDDAAEAIDALHALAVKLRAGTTNE